MLSTPRQHHYEFAHRALLSAMYEDPQRLMAALCSDDAASFLGRVIEDLRARLMRSGAMPPPNGFVGIEVHPVQAAGLPVVIVQMPLALAPAEAIFVALFVTAEGAPRIHTLELARDASGARSTMACEWRGTSKHLNHGASPAPQVEAYRVWLEAFLTQ